MKSFLITVSFFLTLSCNKNNEGTKQLYKISTEINNISELNPSMNNDSIFNVVEIMPILLECETEEFKKKCSDQKLLSYIFKGLKYNAISKENGIEGAIVISFVIEKDGTITNIETIKGKGHTNIEDVIRNLPKWKPGSQNGDFKRVKFNLPIRVNYK